VRFAHRLQPHRRIPTAKNRKIGQAELLGVSDPLTGGKYDRLETSHASWIRELAHPFRHLLLRLSVKKSNASMFETLMTLVVLVMAGVLFQLYFRVRTISVHEAIFVGWLWLAVITLENSTPCLWPNRGMSVLEFQ
jgi:hypothetical protein